MPDRMKGSLRGGQDRADQTAQHRERASIIASQPRIFNLCTNCGMAVARALRWHSCCAACFQLAPMIGAFEAARHAIGGSQ